MSYNPNNPNGQATMANSAPVVVASDQSTIPVLASQSGTWILGANSGIDIGDVTVNNGSGASAVNIQDGGNSITIDGTVTANAGTGNFTVVQATASNLNANVTGSVSVSNFPVTQPVSGTVAATQSGSWNVGINNGAGASAVNIQDGGNSITVDGTVTANAGTGTFNVSGTVAATQSGTWVLGANSGVDIGDVTINNGSGGNAVNIQDGGNSITVDGTVTANAGTGTFAVSGNVGLNAGTNYVGKVRLTDGTTDAEVIPLTNYNAQAVAIVDGSGNQVTSFGGGTQYADGTAVATPTGTVALGFDGTNVQALSTDINGYLNASVTNILNTNLDPTVQLTGTALTVPYYGLMVLADSSGTSAPVQSDGTNLKVISASNPGVNIGDVVVSSGNVAVAGDVGHDSPDQGNPVKIGFKADAVATLAGAVANNDRVDGVADRYGRQLVAHIDPAMQVWKSAEYTSTQTGANIWVPTAGNRFVVTQLNIATGGTTAGLVTIWAAQTATTAYTPGTDQVFFRGTLTPTANATPGALIQPPYPMFSDTLNDCLKITTSANMTIYIQVYGYEIIP